MVYFTGAVKLVVCEASDLKPTDFSTRLQASHLISQQTVRTKYIGMVSNETYIQATPSFSFF